MFAKINISRYPNETKLFIDLDNVSKEFMTQIVKDRRRINWDFSDIILRSFDLKSKLSHEDPLVRTFISKLSEHTSRNLVSIEPNDNLDLYSEQELLPLKVRLFKENLTYA